MPTLVAWQVGRGEVTCNQVMWTVTSTSLRWRHTPSLRTDVARAFRSKGFIPEWPRHTGRLGFFRVLLNRAVFRDASEYVRNSAVRTPSQLRLAVAFVEADESRLPDRCAIDQGI